MKQVFTTFGVVLATLGGVWGFRRWRRKQNGITLGTPNAENPQQEYPNVTYPVEQSTHNFKGFGYTLTKPVLPSGVQSGKVILVHGGGFVTGTRTQAELKKLELDLASYGYEVFNTDYPLRRDAQQSADTMRQAADAAAGHISLLIGSVGHSGDFVTLIGASAGGIAVLKAAFGQQSGQVKGVVNLWGAVEDPSILSANGKQVLSIHNAKDKVVPPGISTPIPSLTLYGTEAMAAAAPDFVTPVIYGRGGHGTGLMQQYDPTLVHILNFLYRLRPKPAPALGKRP